MDAEEVHEIQWTETQVADVRSALYYRASDLRCLADEMDGLPLDTRVNWCAKAQRLKTLADELPKPSSPQK